MHPALRSRHRTKSDAGCSVKMRDCCSEEVKLGLEKGLDQMTNEVWGHGYGSVKIKYIWRYWRCALAVEHIFSMQKIPNSINR